MRAALSPSEVNARRDQLSTVIIDVRERDEIAFSIPGATNIPLGELRNAIVEIAVREQLIVFYCQTGKRSAQAAEMISDIGLTTASLDGGIEAWMEEGLPVAGDTRHSRQINIPSIGIEGQQRLAAATVAIVGVGGLGSPVSLYLAAAGVGRIVLIDPDEVTISNLARQIAHSTARLGMNKAESAADAIFDLDPGIAVDVRTIGITKDNAVDELVDLDVIIDCTDDFLTRNAISVAGVDNEIPVVHGSAIGFEGEVTVFPPEGPCYMCMVPTMPPDGVFINCNTSGILGPATGVIGSLQAMEAIKLITGAGETLAGRVLHYDGFDQSVRYFKLEHDYDCLICGGGEN